MPCRWKANKKTVVDFYEKGLNQKDFEAASKYFGPQYIRHNPTAPDGPQGFKGLVDLLRSKFRTRTARSSGVRRRRLCDPACPQCARTGHPRLRHIVDIFRLDQGKIVEHWDVRQDVPEQAANPNTMF